MSAQETNPIPRISALDPKFREPRTEAEMIPVRIAELAAWPVPPCPASTEHGLCVPRDPRGQTYEQLYCGIWWDCTKCKSSAHRLSRELAHYHGEPYSDGRQWFKYDSGRWAPISDDEAAAFWQRRLAWQNARSQEMTRAGCRRGPMPTVTYGDSTYKLRSRKTQVPDLDAMDRTAALIWLNQNTTRRGYSKAPSPLQGMGGAVAVTVR